MSDELVIRLRDYYARRSLPTWGEIHDAADEIHKLRTALNDLIDNVGGHGHWDKNGTHGANCPICIRQFEAKERARTALGITKRLPGSEKTL